MASLTARIVELHRSLARANLPHAFGGALALAWCTRRARGTIDIDINVFISSDDWEDVIDALPGEIRVTRRDRQLFKRDGQVRLWWDTTPVDLFLNTTPYHDQVAGRVRRERFAEHVIPFLSCDDLAVFKAFYNRTKDWADLEEMQAARTLDVDRVIALISQYLGSDDERVEKLNQMKGSVPDKKSG
jgi:hypothetical protein